MDLIFLGTSTAVLQTINIPIIREVNSTSLLFFVDFPVCEARSIICIPT
jgi:hypothetical protein